jgi:large subunit ribosomal protein L28
LDLAELDLADAPGYTRPVVWPALRAAGGGIRSANLRRCPVASVCDVCGKGPGFGMSVSHSHRRTHRRWNPNVQTVRALVAPGTRKRLSVCTSCLKAGKVTRG